jgi:hypothetical protein
MCTCFLWGSSYRYIYSYSRCIEELYFEDQWIKPCHAEWGIQLYKDTVDLLPAIEE